MQEYEDTTQIYVTNKSRITNASNKFNGKSRMFNLVIFVLNKIEIAWSFLPFKYEVLPPQESSAGLCSLGGSINNHITVVGA